MSDYIDRLNAINAELEEVEAMSTVRELAEKYRAMFKMHERSEDDVIWTLKDEFRGDNSGLELVAATHDNREMSPDDYRYEWTVDALDSIIDADEDADLDELEYEIEPDIYNSDLLRWLSSRADRYSYVDERVEMTGYPENGLMEALQMGQAEEKSEVFRAVLEFLRDKADED